MPQQREGSESVVYRARYLSTDLLSLGETLCREGEPAAQPPGFNAVRNAHAGQPGCSAGRRRGRHRIRDHHPPRRECHHAASREQCRGRRRPGKGTEPPCLTSAGFRITTLPAAIRTCGSRSTDWWLWWSCSSGVSWMRRPSSCSAGVGQIGSRRCIGTARDMCCCISGWRRSGSSGRGMSRN